MGWQPETQPEGKPPVEKTKGAETMQRLIDANAFERRCMFDKNIEDMQDVIYALRDFPTIDAEPQWIPCSERLPEDSGDYLVRPSDSVLEDYSDFSEIMIMPYDADCEAFGWWVERYHPISLGYLDSDFNEFEVLAWMPLPKPYEGETE